MLPDLQTADGPQHIQAGTIGTIKRQRVRIQAHQHIAAGPQYVCHPHRIGVNPIPKQHVSPFHRHTPPRLPLVHVGQLEEIALEVRQVDRIMQAPIRAGAARLTHAGGVHCAQAPSR